MRSFSLLLNDFMKQGHPPLPNFYPVTSAAALESMSYERPLSWDRQEGVVTAVIRLLKESFLTRFGGLGLRTRRRWTGSFLKRTTALGW